MEQEEMAIKGLQEDLDEMIALYNHENDMKRMYRKQNRIMIAALEKIGEDFGTDYADGHVMIAREALERCSHHEG